MNPGDPCGDIWTNLVRQTHREMNEMKLGEWKVEKIQAREER